MSWRWNRSVMSLELPAAILVVLVSVSSPALAGKPPEPAGLFLATSEGQPVPRIALDVLIDGTPHAQHWRRALRELFRFYDRDADGTLSRQEAALLPSPFSLRQVAWNPISPVASRVSDPESLDSNGDGRIVLSEMRGFYHRAGVTGCTLGRGICDAAGRLHACLERAFPSGAPVSLERLAAWLEEVDGNRDQLVAPSELVPGIAYPGTSCALRWSASAAGEGGRERSRALPPRLIFGPEERPLPADSATPTVHARFSTRGGERGAAPQGRAMRRVVERPGLWVDARVDEGTISAEIRSAITRLEEEFREHDSDRNGLLTAAESRPDRASLVRGLLATADCDDDGAVSERELGQWISLERLLAEVQVVVRVLDLQRSSFAVLDSNLDGFLSVRELRGLCGNGASAREGPASASPRTVFPRTAPPRRILLIVSHGRARALLAPAVERGPRWFQAMDRNQDGDISPSEFLGKPADFHRYDRDRDGLIAPEEAGPK